MNLLENHLGGRWVAGRGAGVELRDPILGTPLVRVDATGLDLQGGFAFAREVGGAALRAMSFAQRAQMLGSLAKHLQAHRERYFEIALANSGTVQSDSAVDIDGALFTLGQYARMGASLPETAWLPDGEAVSLAKDGSFQTRHVLQPTRGLALFINAFNFPAWGLWEKAAPALLAGVPVVVKPATATAWLTHRMVQDAIESGLLPPGSLSIVCGSSAGLLDALQAFDVLSFTGSADTAATIRSHAAIARRSVRVNIEADSVNSALLLPGSGDDAVALFVKELCREMTVKSGQKCTAIRRAFVPKALYGRVLDAVHGRLARTVVGNPRHANVTMGALVNRAQWQTALDGIEALQAEADLVLDGRRAPLVDADAHVAACLGPTLLGVADPGRAAAARTLHEVEVFGPVATLMAYEDLPQAEQLVARGEGSLVASLYGDEDAALARAALSLAPLHGRVHVVSPAVAGTHTGHGNVMPQSLHGGPGRAGGGEELGGLRALNFYQRRTAIQAATGVLQSL